VSVLDSERYALDVAAERGSSVLGRLEHRGKASRQLAVEAKGESTLLVARPALGRRDPAPAAVSRLAEIAILQTPDGHGRLELTKFHTPSTQGGNRHAPANTPGIRHVAFAVEDIDAVVAGLRARGAELVGELERYEDSYRLCYVRGPEGIIVELAEQIG